MLLNHKNSVKLYMTINQNTYGAGQIKYLKNLEPVRKTPGMYIGDEEQAIKQMLWEVVDNSVDEYLAQHNKIINITIDSKLKKFTVEDKGRGIPIETHPEEKISTLELVLTKLHAGGKFGQSGYKFSGGLHGVGVSATNALSKYFYAEVSRDGEKWCIEFSKGEVVHHIKFIGLSETTGTIISFIPDDEILPHAIMPPESVIAERLHEIAMLNTGLKITLTYDGNVQSFYEESFKNVMQYYVNDFICNSTYVNDKADKFELETIFGWSKTQEMFVCFTNGIRQSEGGDHLRGAYMAITDIVLKYVQEYQNKMNRKTPVVKQEDVKSNLCILLSLKMMGARFTSQTKEKLSSADARTYIKNIIYKVFGDYMENNPLICKTLVNHAISVATAREDASKDKVVIKGSKSLPSQLAVCTSKKPSECELFIVEGDGAGGSARMGRDRTTQAVLPINGKLLNVMRASPQKIYNSASIKALMSSIGIDYNKEFDIDKLNYHKIIILTDADTDGLHILTLLLIFFIQTRPEIVSNGFIYIVYPPLYKVTLDRKSIYAQDNNALYDIIYSKFVINYPLLKNNNHMSAENVKTLFLDLQDYYNECKNKNLHIDSSLIMLLSYHNIDEISSVLQSDVKLIKETDQQKTLVISSLYGTNTYVINKTHCKFNINVNTISHNNNHFNNIGELYNFILTNRNKGIVVTRFKGLGEMNFSELEETCLNAAKRQLVQVKINPDDYVYMINYCKLLMDSSPARTQFLKKALGIDIKLDSDLVNDNNDEIDVDDVKNNKQSIEDMDTDDDSLGDNNNEY